MILPCILTACATTTASVAPASFCQIAKPIYWSAEDTDETIRQAKSHNAAWKALCPSAAP